MTILFLLFIGSVALGYLCRPIVKDVIDDVPMWAIERVFGILGMMVAIVIGGWSLIVLIAVSLARLVTS